MTVRCWLYGLVNFPGGRFIAQVYRCSPSRLLAIGLFIEITMSAGSSGGNWWYAIGGDLSFLSLQYR